MCTKEVKNALSLLWQYNKAEVKDVCVKSINLRFQTQCNWCGNRLYLRQLTIVSPHSNEDLAWMWQSSEISRIQQITAKLKCTKWRSYHLVLKTTKTKHEALLYISVTKMLYLSTN